MDKVTKDLLVLVALELNAIDLLNFCDSSGEINRKVCSNKDFWLKRFAKDYPLLDISKVKNYKGLYEYLQDRAEDVKGSKPESFVNSYVLHSKKPFPNYSPEYFAPLGTPTKLIIDNGTVEDILQNFKNSKKSFYQGIYGEIYPILFNFSKNASMAANLYVLGEIVNSGFSTLASFNKGAITLI